MNTLRKGLCILLTMFVAALGLQNVGQCKDDKPGFYATVQDQFARWDLNHDGVLSADEILKAFENPKYTGRAGAAIAVLQKIETRHAGHHEPLESFTMSRLTQMESEAIPGHDKNQSTFISCLKKINAASPELFAHGVPQIDEIHQGAANDCYFLCVVAALAHERPRDLARLIEKNPGGSFTVHFFGTAPIRVSCLTAGEISAYNSDAGDGLWLPVLLKAYGEYRLNTKWKLGSKATPVEEDPVEAVAIHGGRTAPIVALLTGHGVKTHRPSSIAGDLRKRLVKAFDEHRLVLVGVPGHAMTAFDYDTTADQVEIWNPWGSSGKYKELDAKMQHGFFSIPVSEFVERCTHVVFEDPNTRPGSNQKHDDNHKHRRGRG